MDSPAHLPVNIKYTQVEAKGDFADSGVLFWNIVSHPFNPALGADSLRGHELLSKMQVDHPVGIPGGGVLIIRGEVETRSDAVISVGALIETSAGAFCGVSVHP